MPQKDFEIPKLNKRKTKIAGLLKMRIQFLSYVYNNQYTDGRPEYFEYDKRPSPLYMRNVTKRLIMRLYTIWRRQRCGWKATVYYM